MTFCTNCGTQLNDDARFCVNCGRALNSSPAIFSAAPPPEPLEYSIEGHNLQIARVHLKPGQEIYAEAGKMVYKSANVA